MLFGKREKRFFRPDGNSWQSAFSLWVLQFVLVSGICEAGLNQWTTRGPEGGSIQRIEINSQNPEEVYVVDAYNGVFKSTDRGESWTAANAGIARATFFDFQIDDLNPSTLYVSNSKSGIFRSTDKGITWTPWTLQGTYVYYFAQQPGSSEIFYALLALEGLQKTTDSGMTWLPIDSTAQVKYADIFIDPFSPTTLFTAFDYGIQKSTDGGNQWVDSSKGLPEATLVSNVVFDPSRSSTLYLDSCNGLFRSTDSGNNWEIVLRDTSCLNSVVIDPSDPNRIYRSNRTNLQKTTNGGVTWFSQRLGLPRSGIWRLKLDPQAPSRIYVGTSDGVYLSLNGAKSWKSKKRGMLAISPGHLKVSSEKPTTLYGLKSGLLKSTDSGKSWAALLTQLRKRNNRIASVALDYSDNDILYASLFGSKAMIKSTNAGTTWYQVKNGLPDRWGTRHVRIDPINPRTLYTVAYDQGYDYVFRSQDAAEHWKRMGQLEDGQATALTIDPQNTEILYVASSETIDPVGCYKYVYKSFDSGTTWEEMLSDFEYFDFDCEYNNIVVDPVDTNIVYVTGDEGLLRSFDGGVNWEDRTNGLPVVNSVTLDPEQNTTLYASSLGAFKSTDGGLSWKPFSTGFPDVEVREILFDIHDLSVLYAGTSEGLYSIEQVPNCLFCDDFEDGDVSDWKANSAIWGVTDGDVLAESGRQSTILTPSTFIGCSICNVSSRMQSVGKSDGGTISLIGWYQDSNNYLELQMDEGSDVWILKHHVGGRVAKIEKLHSSILSDTTYYATIQFDGVTCRVFVDQKLLGTMIPAASLQGVAGFRVNGSGGRFLQLAVF